MDSQQTEKEALTIEDMTERSLGYQLYCAPSRVLLADSRQVASWTRHMSIWILAEYVTHLKP